MTAKHPKCYYRSPTPEARDDLRLRLSMIAAETHCHRSRKSVERYWKTMEPSDGDVMIYQSYLTWLGWTPDGLSKTAAKTSDVRFQIDSYFVCRSEEHSRNHVLLRAAWIALGRRADDATLKNFSWSIDVDRFGKSLFPDITDHIFVVRSQEIERCRSLIDQHGLEPAMNVGTVAHPKPYLIRSGYMKSRHHPYIVAFPNQTAVMLRLLDRPIRGQYL